MGKLSRFLFIGGMTALLTSSAWANLYFSVPHVGRGDNRYIEVGATATIQVLYDNDTAADVNIDAVKLYLEYTASIINQASVRINNNNGSSLTDQKNDTTIAGKIDFEARNMPGQTLLAVPSGRTGVVLATVTFRVNQWDLLVGEEDYFIRFTAVDTNNNVQVVDSGANVSGSRINPIDDVATALHQTRYVPDLSSAIVHLPVLQGTSRFQELPER